MNEEHIRLETTLKYVEESIYRISKEKGLLDDSVAANKRHFNSESSQQYIDLMIGSMMQDRMELKLKNLIKARSKPYFARIDFCEDIKEDIEKLYIGKMALIREENQELIIVDWRAPIANLYYEGRLGDAHYVCPDGDINGRLLLKRQFTINNGILENMADIDITTNDEFLQASLGANADNRLKEIVSTIQEEQNKVIRANMWTPLIVQGAAGSGKTTIALHRIAYLIYTFEKSFDPENFMIVAPNKLFLNYISDILPELGVERAKQSTFEDFANMIIGKKLKINDANEKLNIFVNLSKTNEQKKQNELLKRASIIKSEMKFREYIDSYIEDVEKSFIPNDDFTIMGYTLYSYDELFDLFINEYKRLPIAKRINELKKHMTNKLSRHKKKIIAALENNCEKKILKIKALYEETEERRSIISDLIDKKNEKIAKLQTEAKKAVSEYIKKISKLDPVEYYNDFIQKREYLKSGEEYDYLCEYTKECINKGYVDIEDLAPIIYMKYKIHGIDEKIPVKHIVIDEAQDFSVFQIYVLKKIIKDSSFTILGDLAQGIHSYRGTTDWDEVSRHVFDGKCELLILEQTYRTTVEIAEASNKVIAKLKDNRLKPAKPVIRHGQKVELIKKQDKEELASFINDEIVKLKEKGYKSIAIICKTIDECNDVLPLIKKHKDGPYIINGKEKEYKSGIVVVPSYLAKGLEFDGVFIFDVSIKKYKLEELDVKLLYVAMTRALHNLYLCVIGTTVSQLLTDIE